MSALRSCAASASFAEATAELSEWFWDGCLEECSEVIGEALLNSALAQANFDALASLDSVSAHGQSVAMELLRRDALPPQDVRVLTEAIRSRPRLFRVGPVNAFGRRTLHEVNGGARRAVHPDHWPVRLNGGDLIVGRLIGTGDASRWIGPVYPFPCGTPGDVIIDVRQGLRELDQACPTELAAATERFLVDLHHQWFFHVFATHQQPVVPQDPAPPFTLLRGTVRPSG